MNLAADVRKFHNFKKIQELVAKEQPQAKVEMQQMDLPGVLDS